MIIKNLEIKKRIELFSELNIEFIKGNLYYIMAPNGSGKTTLFKTIMGLNTQESGTIEIDDDSILFYFESSNIFDLNLSGKDYLNYIKAMWDSQLDIKVMIDFWNMADWIELPIKKYSLGMKQKLLISCYYISSSDIWLLDEPSNGLDDESRYKLIKLLESEKENKIIICVSHNIQDLDYKNNILYEIKNLNLERKYYEF